MLIVSSTRRLADHHRLEAALERGVLLDVLAVLVERRRADGVQLAARQHRLQHVRRVHRAFGRAGADDGVQLVDEQDDLALGVGDLLEHRLQALLELAAVLRAGDQRAHVERDDPLVLEPFGHVAADDAAGEAFDDGGLADAGLADEHRVVLGAARQHLDDAADLLVAADHRIELALARELGQVAAVALERLVGAFGVLAGDALRAADRSSSACEDRVARDARGRLSSSRGGGAAGLATRSPTNRCSVLTNSSFSRSASACARSVTSLQARRQPRLRAAVRLRAACRAARARRAPTAPDRRSSCAAAPGRCRRAARPARPAGARARPARGCICSASCCAPATASWAFSVYLLMFIVVSCRLDVRRLRACLRLPSFCQRLEVRALLRASAARGSCTSTVA